SGGRSRAICGRARWSVPESAGSAGPTGGCRSGSWGTDAWRAAGKVTRRNPRWHAVCCPPCYEPLTSMVMPVRAVRVTVGDLFVRRRPDIEHLAIETQPLTGE